MNYKVFTLENVEKNELESRLYFDIATARSLSYTLLKFEYKNDEKFEKQLARKLREIKRKGKLEFFVFSFDFDKNTTEIQFLFNKFPALVQEELSGEDGFVFVKI